MDAPKQPSRRSFLNYMAYAMGGIAVGASGLVMIDSMNPARDAWARDITEINLTKIKSGERHVAVWRRKPIFVYHRTQQDIIEARDENWRKLRDPQSDEERVQKGHDEWLVVIGACTVRGCILIGNRDDQPRGRWGGWFCPCCGAEYDKSGRARIYPAFKNMDVPPYSFEADGMLWIGKGQFPS